MENTEPLPMPVNWGMLFPMTVAPRMKYMTRERAMMPTARVTMNGGSFALVMMIPFRKPNDVATARQARMATASGTAGLPSGVHHPLQEDEDRPGRWPGPGRWTGRCRPR